MVNHGKDQENLDRYRAERDSKRQNLLQLQADVEALDQIVGGLEKRLAAIVVGNEIAGSEPSAEDKANPALASFSIASSSGRVSLRRRETIPELVVGYLEEFRHKDGVDFDEMERRLLSDGAKTKNPLRATLHNTISNLRKKGFDIQRVGSKGASRYLLLNSPNAN